MYEVGMPTTPTSSKSVLGDTDPRILFCSGVTWIRRGQKKEKEEEKKRGLIEYN